MKKLYKETFINKMDFIFIGDPHFKITNLEIVDVFIYQCLNIVKETKPKFIVVGGDLLHTHERLHTTPFNKACKFIKDLSLLSKVFVLVGNHDYENNQQFLTNKHWLNPLKEIKNCEIVDEILHQNINGKDFIFSPYVPVGRFVEALNTLKNFDWKKSYCVFGHQEIFGCKMGCQISTDGDVWNEKWPMLISGHIHHKQKPQKNVFYPGSAIQHAFGENEDNIILKANFDKELVFSEIQLDMPKIKIFRLSIEKIKNFNYKPEKLERIKIVCKGTSEEIKQFKKSRHFKHLESLNIKISFILENDDVLTERFIIFENNSFSQIFSKLINRVEDKNIKTEIENILKEIKKE